MKTVMFKTKTDKKYESGGSKSLCKKVYPKKSVSGGRGGRVYEGNKY